VRLEAEAAARAEEQSRLLAHEQKLATIEAEKKKGVHPGVIVGIILLVVGGGVGAYFGVVKPQLDERDQAARISAEQADHERAARELERTRLNAEAEAAQADARAAREAAATATAAAAAAAASMTTVNTGGGGGRRPGSRPGTASSTDSSMMGGSSNPLSGLDF